MLPDNDQFGVNEKENTESVKTSFSLPAGLYERFQRVARRRKMKIGAAAAEAMEEWMSKFDDVDREYMESVFRSGSGQFKPLDTDRVSRTSAGFEHGISAGESLWVTKLLGIMRNGDADLQTGIQLTLTCYDRCMRQLKPGR